MNKPNKNKHTDREQAMVTRREGVSGRREMVKESPLCGDGPEAELLVVYTEEYILKL